jgi:hypothetical protein
MTDQDCARLIRLAEVDMVGAEEIRDEAEKMGALEARAYWHGRYHGLKLMRDRLEHVLAVQEPQP